MKKSKKDYAKELSTLSNKIFEIGFEMSRNAKPNTNFKNLADSIKCITYTLDNYIDILNR